MTGGTSYHRNRFGRRRFLRRFKRHFRRFGRRRSNRLRFGNPRKYSLSKSSGWPAQRVVKLRAFNGNTLTLPAGPASPQQYPLSANGTFDIDGTGRQPLGQDEWAVFFERYVVLASKITVQFAATSSGDPVEVPIVGIQMRDATASVATTIETLVTSGSSVWTVLQPIVNGAKEVLTYQFNAKKWHNVKDVKDADTLEAELDVSDPTDETYFVPFLGVRNNSRTSQCVISITWMIEYIMLLKDPKQLLPSI